MPIGPMRPYTYGRLGRPVASQFGPEALGARFKARSGPAHSHLEGQGRKAAAGGATGRVAQGGRNGHVRSPTAPAESGARAVPAYADSALPFVW